MAPGRTAFLFTALALLTVALFTADLLVGSVSVAPADIWAALTGGDCDPAIRDIILRIRLLKAVTALLAGAALAASGLQMQTLFRNPLAGPYVLGISSGAGVGVALFLLGAPLLGVSAHSFVQSLGIAGAAWLGAALVLLVVMAVSRRIKDIMVILILGMMFGSGHQFHSRDTPIPVERGGAQIVRHLDDGVAGRRHGRQPRPDAPRRRRGARAQRRRHQAAQPAAAGRKLCPHDGAQRATHPYAAVPLHRTAGRYRHRLLRPRGLHRTGRPAPGTHALRQRDHRILMPGSMLAGAACCWSATSFRKPWRCRSTPSRP